MAALQTRAGLIIIGNEVLSAKVSDANTPLLLARLSEAGVRVVEVAILADDEARITAVVRDFAARFDVVITTGGVGPTHDDCTWRAVGAAFDAPMQVHRDLQALVEARLGTAMTAEQLRLVTLPDGTEVLDGGGRFPLLRLRNVYVLPGVPSLVAGRMAQLCALLQQPRPWLATLYLRVDEFLTVPAIDTVVAEFADLEIGSYPIYEDADHKLRLTFEGFDHQRVAAAAARMAGLAGEAEVVRLVWREVP
jgi:molybdenum cofactor synthesis domain-containing protein